MPNNKPFSILSDGTVSYDVKDATARNDISALDAKVDALEVGDLADTDISNPTDRQSLVYDATSGKWINDTGASKEWVGTSAELAQAIAQGEIDDDTNILVTNDYTPGGGGSSLSHLLITSASDSEISILKPDGVSTVVPTQVVGSTTQWECDVDEFGSYTINILLGSSTYTHIFDLKMVGVYSIVYDSVNLVWSEKSFLKFGLLSDIDVSDAVDGEVLKYNGTTHKWENGEPSSNGLLPQLTVVAPSTASAVSISDGTTTIALTKKSGSTTDWECEVPIYATWSVTVVESGADHTYSLVIDSVEYYTVVYDLVEGWTIKKSDSVSSLKDTKVSSLAEAQMLLYNNTNAKWENSGKVSPTPSSTAPSESTVATTINAATGDSKNVPSLWSIKNWSNTMTKRIVYPGTIASGATGIGTWPETLDNPTASDEAGWGWWYDAHFVGLDTLGDGYDMAFKFEPQPDGDIVTLGGYILDTTTGYMCIKFGAPVTTNTNKIAVDVTIVRNNIS